MSTQRNDSTSAIHVRGEIMGKPIFYTKRLILNSKENIFEHKSDIIKAEPQTINLPMVSGEPRAGLLPSGGVARGLEPDGPWEGHEAGWAGGGPGLQVTLGG